MLGTLYHTNSEAVDLSVMCICCGMCSWHILENYSCLVICLSRHTTHTYTYTQYTHTIHTHKRTLHKHTLHKHSYLSVVKTCSCQVNKYEYPSHQYDYSVTTNVVNTIPKCNLSSTECLWYQCYFIVKPKLKCQCYTNR